MNPYEAFSTSAKLEQEGVILDYGEFQIKVSRAGKSNKKYKKALEKYSRPHRRAIQTGVMSEKVANKILVDTYADSVVLDWQKVTDRKGKSIPFNRDNVVKLLLDLPDLFSDIQDQASTMALFQEEEKEADAKNS